MGKGAAQGTRSWPGMRGMGLREDPGYGYGRPVTAQSIPKVLCKPIWGWPWGGGDGPRPQPRLSYFLGSCGGRGGGGGRWLGSLD
jgi:hypothetical protein